MKSFILHLIFISGYYAINTPPGSPPRKRHRIASHSSYGDAGSHIHGDNRNVQPAAPYDPAHSYGLLGPSNIHRNSPPVQHLHDQDIAINPPPNYYSLYGSNSDPRYYHPGPSSQSQVNPGPHVPYDVSVSTNQHPHLHYPSHVAVAHPYETIEQLRSDLLTKLADNPICNDPKITSFVNKEATNEQIAHFRDILRQASKVKDHFPGDCVHVFNIIMENYHKTKQQIGRKGGDKGLIALCILRYSGILKSSQAHIDRSLLDIGDIIRQHTLYEESHKILNVIENKLKLPATLEMIQKYRAAYGTTSPEFKGIADKEDICAKEKAVWSIISLIYLYGEPVAVGSHT